MIDVYTDAAGFRAAGHTGPVWVTLGTFDGLHRGHQALIGELIERALGDATHASPSDSTPAVPGGDAPTQRARTLVITFEIHPRALLDGQRPRPLTSIEHKLRLLEGLGVDAALVIAFDDAVARIEPEAFIERWLVHDLKVDRPGGGVLLGYNNRFGHGGRGDFALLAREAERHGFTAARGAPVQDAAGETISSTAIRRAIDRADLDRAAELLGRPYGVMGRVVHGANRGASIGFPTANVEADPESRPPIGVYGVRVREMPPPPRLSPEAISTSGRFRSVTSVRVRGGAEGPRATDRAATTALDTTTAGSAAAAPKAASTAPDANVASPTAALDAKGAAPSTFGSPSQVAASGPAASAAARTGQSVALRGDQSVSVRGSYTAALQGDNWGVANIGVRPTLGEHAGDAPPVLEVHLLDYEGDVYGRDIEVEFLVRLREEKKFGSVGELSEQIARDVTGFRAWVASNHPS